MTLKEIQEIRINEAKKILGNKAKLFHIRAYQCNPEYCGHSDSIILSELLSIPHSVPICFSLEELKKEFGYCKYRKDKNIIKSMLGIK